MIDGELKKCLTRLGTGLSRLRMLPKVGSVGNSSCGYSNWLSPIPDIGHPRTQDFDLRSQT